VDVFVELLEQEGLEVGRQQHRLGPQLLHAARLLKGLQAGEQRRALHHRRIRQTEPKRTRLVIGMRG
jgi:hypothetical protein